MLTNKPGFQPRLIFFIQAYFYQNCCPKKSYQTLFFDSDAYSGTESLLPEYDLRYLSLTEQQSSRRRSLIHNSIIFIHTILLPKSLISFDTSKYRSFHYSVPSHQLYPGLHPSQSRRNRHKDPYKRHFAHLININI